MTMVYETRKVIEDFVLYKIKQHVDASSNLGSSNHSQQRLTVRNYVHFPLPQDPPSEINESVRRVADDFEERYKNAFPDLLEGIRANHIANANIDKVFTRITRDLFGITVNGNSGYRSATSSPSGGRKLKSPPPAPTIARDINQIEDEHIKWGHVIGLLVFSGIMAVRCVEINSNEQVDEIVNWVAEFLDIQLGSWLRRQGGWTGFALWYKQSRGASVSTWFDQYQLGSGLKTAIRITGVAAALALTASMFLRK